MVETSEQLVSSSQVDDMDEIMEEDPREPEVENKTKAAPDPEPDKIIYRLTATKGMDSILSPRDIDLIKRRAKDEFAHPIQRVFGQHDDGKNPEEVLNLNHVVRVYEDRTGGRFWEDKVKKWRADNPKRHYAVLAKGGDVALSDKDYRHIMRRTRRQDATSIIVFQDSVDGTILLNMDNLIRVRTAIED